MEDKCQRRVEIGRGGGGGGWAPKPSRLHLGQGESVSARPAPPSRLIRSVYARGACESIQTKLDTNERPTLLSASWDCTSSLDHVLTDNNNNLLHQHPTTCGVVWSLALSCPLPLFNECLRVVHSVSTTQTASNKDKPFPDISVVSARD